MREKISCIYKATNKVNGRIYIGKTRDLNRRIIEHKRHAKKDKSPFHDDVLRYGLDSFQIDIIEQADPEDLDSLEVRYIKEYREKLGEDCLYNICKGGRGGQTHDITGVNNPMFGKEVSPERRKHLSEMLTGRKKPDGFGEKVSKALKGKKKSPEAVAKKSTPIAVFDLAEKTLLKFPSIAEMRRQIKADITTLKKGKISKGRYILPEFV